MLLDRTHRTWALISAAIMAVATASYVLYAESTPKGPSGGSLMGLIYGVFGSLMMIYAGLLGGRKQFPFWRLGSAQFWLRGHIWFGTLSFPLILFHAGFGLGGLLEQILMGFFFVVWLSGFFGLAMQHLMPKLLTSRIGRETFADQIPYIRKRNRIIADKLVSSDCGKIPLDGDAMQKDLTRLGIFAADIMSQEKQAKGKAAKDEVSDKKATWLERVAADDIGLFQDLAKHAKNEGWVNKIGNFPDQMVAIYQLPETAKPAAETGEKTTVKAEGSPLDQIKGKKAASPLDQMKAQRAISPLEQMKAKVAAADGDDASKPKSPLEMARKAGGAGSGGSGKPDESPVAKLSPLEMIRQQGAFGSGGSQKAALAPAAKLSPLEMIRQQGAFGSGGSQKAALASAAPAAKPPVKQVAPAPKTQKKPEPISEMVDNVDSEISAVQKLLTEKYGFDDQLARSAAEKTRKFLTVKQVVPAPKTQKKVEPISEMVDNVDSEISAIQKLLTEKYGFDDQLARSAAEKTRKFLKTNPEADVTAVKQLFIEKYGYDESKATDIAEKVRPFVDGSIEKAAAEKAEKAIAAKAPTPTNQPTAEAPSATAAPLSKTDQIRQQGAFGSGGAKKQSATPAAASSSKNLSSLEQLKAKVAAGKPAASGKALSPLEMMKNKAGGGTKPEAAKPAAKKPPAPVKKKAAVKRPVLRTEELRNFYLTTARPYLAGSGKMGRLADITEASRAFAQMRGTLPVELHETLESLQAFCEEHRQFTEQIRIRAWLHYWLAIHIPFSIALFVLMAAHIVLALRVVPWDFPIRF